MGKKKANQLGRSLIKDRFGQGNRKTVADGSMVSCFYSTQTHTHTYSFLTKRESPFQLHTTEVQDGYDWGRLNLQSVTEESSFRESVYVDYVDNGRNSI